MSRSYRKTPVIGLSKAESEKQDKQRAHQAERTHVRTELARAVTPDDVDVVACKNAYSNTYSFAKDGKQWLNLPAQREGRALKEVSGPGRLRSPREVHKLLGK